MDILPEPNNVFNKTGQLNIRVDPDAEHDLALLRDFYPEWSTGKIVRACLAIVAKMHKEKSK
jgi:hypothetical protein